MNILSKTDPRSLLRKPIIYHLHSRMAASRRRKQQFVDRFLRVKAGERILDIGCGTASLLSYLPDVAYVGFDISETYIDYARQLHDARGEFHHRPLTMEAAYGMPPFDLALANGVVHHLDDDEAVMLFQVARSALAPGGRLVTCDGTFVSGQHPLSRMLLKMDRGSYIRSPDAYRALARAAFDDVDLSVHHDLNSIPYTHCVMTCR